jgi:hypothetical protein
MGEAAWIEPEEVERLQEEGIGEALTLDGKQIELEVADDE